MRSFLAFEIPPKVKAYLSQVSEAMAKSVPGVRWVRPEGQHITIRVFGEISDARAREITEVLGAAGPSPGVETTLNRIDAFPDRRRPRVIVATIDEGVDIIRSIYHDIETRLTALGYEREKRGFHPHITFGRMKCPRLFWRETPPLECPRFAIERIILYKSILGREGATYEPLFEKELGAEK